MLRIAFLIIIFLHGSLHFIGLAKSLGCGNVQQLQIPTSKLWGLTWSIAGILFITLAFILLQYKQNWWLLAVAAVILSQILIITNWHVARAGTIANIIILVAAIGNFFTYRFENTFKNDVSENLLHNNSFTNELVTEKDIAHLPLPVQKYLQYAGVINKPKVKSARIILEGKMRDKGKDYFPFVSEQYNFFDEPTRLFFMKGQMFGITVPGYHHYIKAEAVMDIRLFGLYPIVQNSGTVMNKTETVTLFNEMCLLAPASLIDKRIQWQIINDSCVTAVFTNHNISIAANLFFNKQDQLINFVSEDRTSVSEMKEFPFSTPVSSYHKINGYNIMSAAEATWHYPDGDFTYGQFNLKSIEYNVAAIK